MKYVLFLFILIGCSENNHTYFPLGKIKSWSYKIEIEPEVDKKTVYKKTNLSLGKKKLELEGKRTDKRDPIKGIKFRKKEKIPKVGAKSFSKKKRIMNVNIPVNKLVTVLS